MRRFRSFAVETLSAVIVVLLACPPPVLRAGNVVSPVAAQGGVRALPKLPNQIISGVSLPGLKTLSVSGLSAAAPPQGVPDLAQPVEHKLRAFLRRVGPAVIGADPASVVDAQAGLEAVAPRSLPAADTRILRRSETALAPFQEAGIRRMPLENLASIARNIWEGGPLSEFSASIRTQPTADLLRNIMRELARQNLPTRGFLPALEADRADPAGAVARALATPNMSAAAWARVKAPAKADPALIDYYVRAGLLRRAEDGNLYARLRDPSMMGTDPQHNRCLGTDSCMSKGTGTFKPVGVALSGGEKASVALYRDPAVRRASHVLQGVLTADQAQAYVNRDYRKLLASLKRELSAGGAALRKLAAKHHVTVDIIPNRFLTLELEALPIAPEGESAARSLRAISGGLATVAPSVQREAPHLIWLKPAAYWKIARTGGPEDAENPRAVVQLYTANHAALRGGTMRAADGKAIDNVPSMPELDWDARYSEASAAVRIGWWAAVFKDYGWEIRREAGGKLRVYELASGRPLAVGKSRALGSLQAARVVSEGNALVSGFFLRSLWRANLTPVGSLGGTPFQGRNSNPRARLDLDTIGPQAEPRPIGLYAAKRITPRESRKFDLTWSGDPFYWKEGMWKKGSPLHGVRAVARALGLDDNDASHGMRLMLRAAYGGRLERYADDLVPLPAAREQGGENAGRPRAALAPAAVHVELGRDYEFPDLSQFAISVELAKAGVEALRDLFARDGLPRILVNRNADDAVRVLERGYFGTLHTLTADRPDLPPEILEQLQAAVALRRSYEEWHGTYGEGPAAGRTVYGSVRFGDRVGSERFMEDVIQGMRSRVPRSTKPAQGFYLSGGAVTFVMKPAALMNATFLGGDSFMKKIARKPGGIRHLPEVTMTALARIASGQGEEAALRSILRMPAEARREALRRVLASDIFQIDYVEAQIRNPSADDIDCIVIKNDVQDWPAGYLPDPRAGGHAQALEKVRELAKRRGIPLMET
ncbi:MAG TPA: hypothetical protein DEB40_07115 [Elusimicrobia bacterium]|nr:hypothetical protein [Elusimicrobiota bacterium]HBT61498.1 hypothetical protein [Elusimicrobiota bacterium]